MGAILLMMAVVVAGPGEVGDKVVEFARGSLGRKVGDGECTSLAAEALRFAGVRREAGGSWGDPVAQIRDARPGDILQFENATFVQRRARPDGVVVKWTLWTPHHTAVVAATAGRDRDFQMTLLHQNVHLPGTNAAEGKVVQEWTLSPSEMKAGTVKAFRPVPSRRPESGTGGPTIEP